MDTLTRPVALHPNFEGMPKALTELKGRWVLWSYTWDGERWLKIPKHPQGYNASSSKPSSWSDFNVVRAAYENSNGKFDGVGIMLGPQLENGLYLVGLDFDHCIEDETLNHAASEVIEELNTYWEVSPSGSGIRLFLLHDKLLPARKTNKVDGNSREIYMSGRYMTVTGRGNDVEVRHVI